MDKFQWLVDGGYSAEDARESVEFWSDVFSAAQQGSSARAEAEAELEFWCGAVRFFEQSA